MKLTKTEKIILKNTDEKYKYIARDESGDLYVYEFRPYKAYDFRKGKKYWCYFDGIMCGLRAFNHLFQDIKWEDEEPYKFR